MWIVLHTQGDDRYQLNGPIRRPSRYTTKKWFSFISQVVTRASGITAMPRSILRTRSETFTSYWNRMCTQMESLTFYFVFFGQVVVAFVFFSDRCIDHISRTTPPPGRLSVFWVVHDQHRVKTSHPNRSY